MSVTGDIALSVLQSPAMSSSADALPAADWFDTPPGAYLLSCEQAYFDAEVADVFGYNAFQLGLCQHDFLRTNRMPLRVRLGARGDGAAARICTDFHHLPILNNSADLVVLPHVLEFSENPHQVLREVARILMPEGHAIIACFNPWSLWGARRFFGRGRQDFPWRGQFISLPRLKDWMALLGFEMAGGRMACYLPPLAGEQWLHRLSFLDQAGDRWWPFAGGVYFLHGVKKVHGMRVITPRWKPALVKGKSLAAAPQRVGENGPIAAREGNPERHKP
jgi:SAM-dependent methyltransferase